MARKKKIERDSQGQPGGPSDAEQALANAEQLEIMERLKRERAPAEEAENRLRQEKYQDALNRAAFLKTVADMLKDLDRRVTALEGK